jgi:hypothetical protein
MERPSLLHPTDDRGASCCGSLPSFIKSADFARRKRVSRWNSFRRFTCCSASVNSERHQELGTQGQSISSAANLTMITRQDVQNDVQRSVEAFRLHPVINHPARQIGHAGVSNKLLHQALGADPSGRANMLLRSSISSICNASSRQSGSRWTSAPPCRRTSHPR